MQRKNFQITVNGATHPIVKHAWNAAIRETEKIARETARAHAEVLGRSDRPLGHGDQDLRATGLTDCKAICMLVSLFSRQARRSC